MAAQAVRAVRHLWDRSIVVAQLSCYAARSSSSGSDGGEKSREPRGLVSHPLFTHATRSSRSLACVRGARERARKAATGRVRVPSIVFFHPATAFQAVVGHDALEPKCHRALWCAFRVRSQRTVRLQRRHSRHNARSTRRPGALRLPSHKKKDCAFFGTLAGALTRQRACVVAGARPAIHRLVPTVRENPRCSVWLLAAVAQAVARPSSSVPTRSSTQRTRYA